VPSSKCCHGHAARAPETAPAAEELLSYRTCRASGGTLDLDAPAAPFLAVELGQGQYHPRSSSTLTSLGVPYDITLDELRVECFFPAE